MPAEWEEHESTWLVWPTNKTTWPGKLLKEVEEIYFQMMRSLLAGEKVNLLVPNEKVGRFVARRLESKKASVKNLFLHSTKTVDTWIRDYGPIFVKRTGAGDNKAFTKWVFNAWGGKYADLAKDHGVVNRIGALKLFKRFDIGMVLEGGSIDVNGRGVCLTTQQCLLNKNRNPKLSRAEIEQNIGRHLGAKKVIWLKEGIEGDDTDGHVDDVTRFVAPNTILTATESDETDKNYAILKENLIILKSQKNLSGKHFKIIELPMPGKVGLRRGESDSERLPASYANFYIANSCVLVPVYSHRNDKRALGILRDVFPGRKIVAIECTALMNGLGSIHCVTQQEPR